MVVSYYDARSIAPLHRLLEQLDTIEAGFPFDLALVANRTHEDPIDLPPLSRSITLLERPNEGYNIGAWDHAWRELPHSELFLFLQDDAFVVRPGWLRPFVLALTNPKVGLVGESLNFRRRWSDLARLEAPNAAPLKLRDGMHPPFTVEFALATLARWGIAPGQHGTHLQSLIWASRREVLESIDGFPHGASYAEAVAAEIAVSRNVIERGLLVRQVRLRPFSYLGHPQWWLRRRWIDALLLNLLRRTLPVSVILALRTLRKGGSTAR